VNNERQKQILELLEKKGEVQLNELKNIFPGVSTMTLRRDLIAFENEGIAIRTYGGAVNIKKLPEGNGEEYPYSRRIRENVEAKIEIAKKTLSLVETGRSIYLDAGSTSMTFAEKIPDENYSIITSGINIALELMKKQKISVMLPGGLVNRNTFSVSGPSAMGFIDNINIDLAFMSSSGFSIEGGFTISNIYECELKKKVINAAKKVYMLMDTSKINKNLSFTFAKLEDIDIWITEKKLPYEIEEAALKAKVNLL
jgi:DeoR/GlpR family transcriptional regulator of sugar metabolism